MKAEIILTDNNINIDLNEPVIDVSTEDGFSVTIIGGVGPQGATGDDYVLTEDDKDDIAEMAAGEIDLQEYVRKTDYPQVNRMVAGVVKVDTATGIGVDAQGLLSIYPSTGAEIKAGTNGSRPITPKRQYISTFYGLAKAAGVDEKDSELQFGTYTEAAKAAIRVMLGAMSLDEIPEAPVQDIHVNGTSVLDESGVADIPIATTSKLGVVKTGNGLYMQGGAIHLNAAPESILKRGNVTTARVVSSNQHIGVFYGLAKAAGSDMASSANPVGAYTDEAKTAIQTMLDVPAKSDVPEVPVQDVQINGNSILDENGCADIPIASDLNPGVVKVPLDRGLAMTTLGNITVVPAPSSMIKAGEQNYYPIAPQKQHEAVFYGLAKAAGFDEKDSMLPGGQYSAGAKAAIQFMLGIPTLADIIAAVHDSYPAAEEAVF